MFRFAFFSNVVQQISLKNILHFQNLTVFNSVALQALMTDFSGADPDPESLRFSVKTYFGKGLNMVSIYKCACFFFALVFK